ncbi:Murein hydrolase activator EnvC [Anaerolineales bacterium]|nr:Murein hydrolase activator EnvC [Anaerolineales bacterium]
MKKALENIRSFFSALGARFKRKPKEQKAVAAVNEPITTPRGQAAQSAQGTKSKKVDRFSVISWVVTLLLVTTLLGGTVFYKNSHPTATTPIKQPTSIPTSEPSAGTQAQVGAPVMATSGGGFSSISRKLQLKTNIPERERYESISYRVTRGDAMLSIAEQFKLKSETLLYVNAQLEDNPHNLKPGMELTIPPVDGLYYTWKDGDTFDSVAEEFGTTADAIINFPGNRVDLTDPKIEAGSIVMIPGGTRELRNWAADLQTMGRGANTGTGGPNVTNACGGGPVASGYGWPADNHALSGNPYGPGHLGIDITAPEGSNVYAAGSGVVTMAQGGWNYGYGNVVQIDHGNGDVTVYAHLSSYIVGVCQFVGQGTVIGYSGNTGNSFGAHLHFEIRRGGSNINPYDIVQ